MDHITEAFYNVMYQYRLAFTPDGVQANLDLWRQQKTPLLELLRRHPNWREQELAVVFDLSEQRQLDQACVDETKFEMLTLAQEAGLTGERLEEFRDALDAATADYATVPDESRDTGDPEPRTYQVRFRHEGKPHHQPVVRKIWYRPV